MVEPKQTFDTIDQAGQYVQTVRELYRDDKAEYRGRRNEDQQLIAEVTADEARLMVDGAMAGILAMSFNADAPVELPPNYEDVEKAGYKWSDFRGEFERLLVGFGVLTNRLNREKFGVPSYADLSEPDRMKAASVLFGDFLEHNGLRFGSQGTGLKRSIRTHNDEGGIDVKIVDRDKAKDDREIERNMQEREYSTGVATHVAGKMSPEEYVKLRREFPEIDKAAFDRDVGFYTNARQKFEKDNQ